MLKFIQLNLKITGEGTRGWYQLRGSRPTGEEVGPLGRNTRVAWELSLSLSLNSSSSRSCQGTISISIPGTKRAFLPPGAQPTRPSIAAPGRAGGADRRMRGGRPRLTQEALQEHFSPQRGHGRGPERRRRGKPRGPHTRRPAPAAEFSGVGVHASGSGQVCHRPPGRPPTRKPRPGEGGARCPLSPAPAPSHPAPPSRPHRLCAARGPAPPPPPTPPRSELDPGASDLPPRRNQVAGLAGRAAPGMARCERPRGLHHCNSAPAVPFKRGPEERCEGKA